MPGGFSRTSIADGVPWAGPQLDPLLTHHLPPCQVGLLEPLVDGVPWPGPQLDPLLTHHLPSCQVGFLEPPFDRVPWTGPQLDPLHVHVHVQHNKYLGIFL